MTIIKYLIMLLSISGLLSVSSCKEPESTGPENRIDSLVLKFKESDLTSAVLSLHTAGISLPATFSFNRIDGPARSFILHQADTTLKDSLLTPSTTYSWRVEKSANLKSNLATGRTMDTTSHEFTWRVDTLGAVGIARDIAVLSDNDIWVVGEFYETSDDSQEPFNTAHWNGVKWELMKIMITGYGGLIHPSVINAVFAFSNNNIWAFSIAGSYAHFDGFVWKSEFVNQRQGGIYKIWGSSPENIYFIGTNGSMTHYNGNSFSLLSTGTTVNLLDITGTDDKTVWVSGYMTDDFKRIFMKYENGAFQVISRNWIFGIWANPANPDQLWTLDDLYLQKRSVKSPGTVKKQLKGITYFPMAIAGTAENNIFVVGHYVSIVHYNGSTLKTYHQLINEGKLYRLQVTPNKVYAVGDLDNIPIVITGSRY